MTLEVRVTVVHVHPDIRLAGHLNRIDPNRWRPLIMSFQRLASRVAPGAPTSAVVQRIVDLNGLGTVAVRTG